MNAIMCNFDGLTILFLKFPDVEEICCAGIDFKPDTVVEKADLSGKKLITSSGDEISFEKLIIALGSLVSLGPCYSVPDLSRSGR